MDQTKISWKCGYEIELLAPQGSSRLDLAKAIAANSGGTTAPCFHPQAELSDVEGSPVFENLTLGYDAFDQQGNLLARCADDLTLQQDLEPNTAPKAGWYRIAGDDPRFLRLIMRHADPAAPLNEILNPVAKLFGTTPEHLPEGMVRLADSHNASIAIAAPLPGERQRPCEIITPPISKNHFQTLENLLAPARQLSFTIPTEAALHIHFDGEKLCNAKVLSSLIEDLHLHGESLKALVSPNPNCRRLGQWPVQLLAITQTDHFRSLDWQSVRDHLSDIGLTKFCDFNITNLIHRPPNKHTFEVRILPVSLMPEPIIHATALFEAVLNNAITPRHFIANKMQDFRTFLQNLNLNKSSQKYWLDKCLSKSI